MGRRAVAFSEDSVSRAIRAVKKAGVDVKSVRVETDGSVVINAEADGFTKNRLTRVRQVTSDGGHAAQQISEYIPRSRSFRQCPMVLPAEQGQANLVAE
ncbi:hypothetical protein ASC97_07750 [Rhizobium sp. Root1203]|uniref:hypothetical protein n=1 Tax=Rhizobium sp. Root1203 TaxID=1736427 RepID=UPI00070CB93E|nr:hypothetical protein [Rhizobium sp. Root1203]KQV28224.1 hypothetical protein ASC97_07750 [Rhizobium sp. Root1203]